MHQLVAVVCSVNIFYNGEFFQFRACRYGNALWYDWNTRLAPELCVRISELMVPSSLKLTIVVVIALQAEEQILERVEE